MKGEWFLRSRLNGHVYDMRTLEEHARRVVARERTSGRSTLADAMERIADCHAAAALVYETELAKLGEEEAER